MKGTAIKRQERLAREAREAGELRLAKALGHPVRVAILECLNANGPMAPVQIAQQLGAELSNLSYHVRVLAEGGLIVAIRKEKRRGRERTIYRSTMRAYFSDAAWASLSPERKAEISATTFRVLATRASDALQAGTFDSKVTRHLSISTVSVDDEGWDEVAETMTTLTDRLDEIQEESRERGGQLVPMSVGLLSFESPRLYE
jgi:DNA-binding transcriptional ArsR family regulator